MVEIIAAWPNNIIKYNEYNSIKKTAENYTNVNIFVIKTKSKYDDIREMRMEDNFNFYTIFH